MDILAIQEPQFNPQNRSTYNPSSSQFHLFYRGEEGARVYQYINKRLDIDSWEAEYASGDYCSLKLTLKKEQEGEGVQAEVWIYNIYNPSPRSPRLTNSLSTLPQIRSTLQKPGEHILLGDFNLYHPLQNNKGRFSYYTAADALLDITTANQLELALPEDIPTWKARGLESTIDLVFFLEGAYKAIVRYSLREDLRFRSDYIPILTEL